MRRQVRMAALTISFVLALGTFALAQDADDYYYRGGGVAQTRQYGYESGFRDGEKRGRHEGRENDPYDYHTPDWRQATRGYKDWMGPVNAFQNGYQQGYADGFRSGFEAERPGWRGDRDGDRDDGYRGSRYRGNGYYGGNYGYNSRIGYDTGYQDGVTMAREDQYKNKPFNPNPRARFDGRDNGYRREYGDKNAYKAQYSDGYRAGYQSTFNGRY
jgi:hypothetical protein